MDPGPFSKGVHILWHIQDMDPIEYGYLGPNYIGGPYFIIYYGPAYREYGPGVHFQWGPYSI